MADTWDETRIAELRRLAERRRETERAVTMECASLPHRGGWSAPLDDALSADDAARDALLPFLNSDGLLSLLDELESVRRERVLILRDAGFLLELAEFAIEEPDIVGTQTWIGAMDGVRSHAPREAVQ